jgi:integral membrane protein
MELLQSALGRLRIIAFLEGLSFIVLVGVAVPMKYMYGFEHATREIGMIHGILFMTYTYLLYPAKEKLNWSWKQTSMAFAASIIPLGTFVAEYRWFRKIA